MPPFLFYFFQFYPEMLGALVFAVALRCAALPRAGGARRTRGPWALLLATLPWLHQKFLPAWAVLAAWAVLQAGRRAGAAARAARRRSSRRRVSLFLFALYNFAHHRQRAAGRAVPGLGPGRRQRRAGGAGAARPRSSTRATASCPTCPSSCSPAGGSCCAKRARLRARAARDGRLLPDRGRGRQLERRRLQPRPLLHARGAVRGRAGRRRAGAGGRAARACAPSPSTLAGWTAVDRLAPLARSRTPPTTARCSWPGARSPTATSTCRTCSCAPGRTPRPGLWARVLAGSRSRRCSACGCARAARGRAARDRRCARSGRGRGGAAGARLRPRALAVGARRAPRSRTRWRCGPGVTAFLSRRPRPRRARRASRSSAVRVRATGDGAVRDRRACRRSSSPLPAARGRRARSRRSPISPAAAAWRSGCIASGSPSKATVRDRGRSRPASADPAVARVDERQQPVGDQAEGDDPEQPRAVLLALQRPQRAAEVAAPRARSRCSAARTRNQPMIRNVTPRAARPKRPMRRAQRRALGAHLADAQVLLELRRPGLVELVQRRRR